MHGIILLFLIQKALFYIYVAKRVIVYYSGDICSDINTLSSKSGIEITYHMKSELCICIWHTLFVSHLRFLFVNQKSVVRCLYKTRKNE